MRLKFIDPLQMGNEKPLMYVSSCFLNVITECGTGSFTYYLILPSLYSKCWKQTYIAAKRYKLESLPQSDIKTVKPLTVGFKQLPCANKFHQNVTLN